MLTVSEYQGDHSDLSILMDSSWKTDAYSPQLVKHIIDHPQTIPELCFQATVDDKIVSFLYSRSRSVSYKGKMQTFVHNTLAATNPEYAHHIPYIQIRRRFSEKCSELNYSHYSGFTERGIDNSKIAVSFAKLYGHSHRIEGSIWVHDCPKSVGTTIESNLHFDANPIKSAIDKLTQVMDAYHKDNNYLLFECMSSSDIAYKAANLDHGGVYLISGNGVEGYITYQKRLATLEGCVTCNAYVTSMFLLRFAPEVRIEILRKFGGLLYAQGVDNVEILGFTEVDSILFMQNGFPISKKKMPSDLNVSSFCKSGDDSDISSGLFFYDFF